MSAKTLKPVKRGGVWHAQGRICYNGRPITGYIRESTGAAEEAGARDWIEERCEREIRRHLLGDRAALSFAEIVMMYPASPADAGYLMPVTAKIGHLPLTAITPKSVRELAALLYPKAGTDTWLRQVITPVRAVINHAHDVLGPDKVAAIRIKGFSQAEKVAQDLTRGTAGRPSYPPGSWEWLLSFRAAAGRYHGALALFMFMTGARISQAVQMHPDRHLDLDHGRACIPAAKGHADRWIQLSAELVDELQALPPRYPRGWDHKPAQLRVFGFASRFGPRSGWETACAAAGIDYLPPHSAGRHGFGQEMNVRQGVDEKAAAAYGGWRQPELMRKRYTHEEDAGGKVQRAFSTGLAQAEEKTGLTLAGKRAK